MFGDLGPRVPLICSLLVPDHQPCRHWPLLFSAKCRCNEVGLGSVGFATCRQLTQTLRGQGESSALHDRTTGATTGVAGQRKVCHVLLCLASKSGSSCPYFSPSATRKVQESRPPFWRFPDWFTSGICPSMIFYCILILYLGIPLQIA